MDERRLILGPLSLPRNDARNARASAGSALFPDRAARHPGRGRVSRSLAWPHPDPEGRHARYAYLLLPLIGGAMIAAQAP